MKKLILVLCLLSLGNTSFSMVSISHAVAEESCAKCDSHNANKICGGCKLVYYCSQECQKAHWKTHKIACKKAQPQIPLFVADCGDWEVMPSELGDLFERAFQTGSAVPTPEEAVALQRRPTVEAVRATPEFEDALLRAQAGLDELD